MGLSIKDFVETYAEVRAVFEEDIECEHSQHPEGGPLHAGKAEWYGEYHCPHCGNSPGIQAFCSPWKAYVETDNYAQCAECRTPGRANTDFYKGRWTKK